MKKVWYEDGIKFTCRKCGTCCHDHGEYGFVFLSEGEPERIAATLGLDMQVFLDKYCVSVCGCLCLGNDGPACLLYVDGQGCSIYKARPMQCSSWPFWPENLERKEWRRGVEKWCPGCSDGKKHSRAEIEEIAARMKNTTPLPAPPWVLKV